MNRGGSGQVVSRARIEPVQSGLARPVGARARNQAFDAAQTYALRGGERCSGGAGLIRLDQFGSRLLVEAVLGAPGMGR